MEKRFYPIEYKGHVIYYSDWTGLQDGKKMVRVIEETTQAVIELDKYNILEIVDVSKSFALREGMSAAKISAETTEKFSKKKALIGINNKAKQILLNFVNVILGKKMMAFETKEEALEWLIKD